MKYPVLSKSSFINNKAANLLGNFLLRRMLLNIEATFVHLILIRNQIQFIFKKFILKEVKQLSLRGKLFS